jgi:hypothetical protein
MRLGGLGFGIPSGLRTPQSSSEQQGAKLPGAKSHARRLSISVRGNISRAGLGATDDTQHCRPDMTILVEENVTDLADRGIRCVVDLLLVVIGDTS